MTGTQIEHAMTGYINPNDGLPLANGTLEVLVNDASGDYETVYSDINLSTPVSQPIDLNDAGQPTIDGTNPIQLYVNKLVKLLYKDSDGVQVEQTDAMNYTSSSSVTSLSYVIDIAEVYGTSDANINQALIDYGSSNVVFLWKDEFTISTNKTFASTIYHLFAGDGQWTISSSATVTLNGDIEDNGGQGIVCNGTLTFSDSTINVGKGKEFFSGTGVIDGNISNSVVSEDWFATSGIYSTLTYDNNNNVYAKDFLIGGNSLNLIGTIIMHAAQTAPDGFLLCDGSAVSRTTYSDLYSVIGDAWGEGDGSTTFNVPDMRWVFPRGYGVDISVTGTGSASGNQATFYSHGFNRSGVKCRLSSGTLSGLSSSTDYYVIVVDDNTLAFASSRADALTNTRVAVTGANSAVIVQYEDPDASSRTALSDGGDDADNVGSYQVDEFKLHSHGMSTGSPAASSGTGRTFTEPNDVLQTTSKGGNETRPINVYVNYCIKY